MSMPQGPGAENAPVSLWYTQARLEGQRMGLGLGLGLGLILGGGLGSVMGLVVPVVLVALLGLLVLREVAVVLRAGVSQEAGDTSALQHSADTGATPWPSAAPPANAIPPVVWTYWQSGQPPPLVAACIANWRREAPECDIRVLDAESFQAHLPGVALPRGYAALPAYRQADWIRIQLLLLHGGIWLDASLFLTRSLAWVQATQTRSGAEYVGFSIAKFTLEPGRPVIENWFMAAPPRSRFLRDWAEEFDAALALGDEAAYLEALAASGELQMGLQGIPPEQARHLIMHVAASVVLHRNAAPYRLALTPAEDGPFAFHAGVGWRKRHLYARLALTPCPRHLPALVKLRSVDRRVFEKFLTKGWWWRRSALARSLGEDALERLRHTGASAG